MRLLIATDHEFISLEQGGVFDSYCFDRPFFDDYKAVFEQVDVLCRMKIVANLPTGARRSDDDHVHFSGVPSVHGFRWLVPNRSVLQKLELAVENADAVIARVPSQLGWYAARYAQFLKKPYMIEVIGDPYEAVRGIGRSPHYLLIAIREAFRLRKLARKATVASYVSKQHLQRSYPVRESIPIGSVSSIRLGPEDISNFRQYKDLSNRRIRIVLVASLVPVKRHSDIIEAVKLCTDFGVDIEAHFAGNGVCRESLGVLSAQLDIADRIHFYGHVSDKNVMRSLLDDSDIFVMASASEGLPRAAIEAMARGLPVVGSDAKGLQELVRNTETFRVGDTNALALLLCELVRDPKRMSEMSQYSVQQAMQYTSNILSPRRIQLFNALKKATGINGERILG